QRTDRRDSTRCSVRKMLRGDERGRNEEQRALEDTDQDLEAVRQRDLTRPEQLRRDDGLGGAVLDDVQSAEGRNGQQRGGEGYFVAADRGAGRIEAAQSDHCACEREAEQHDARNVERPANLARGGGD